MLPIILKVLAALDVVALIAVIYMMQVDRFDAIRKGLAISALTLFATGAGLIVYLEEIQPFIWDNSSPYAKKKGKGGEQAAAEDEDEDENSSSADTAQGNNQRMYDRSNNTKKDCDDCPEMLLVSGGEFGENIVEPFAISRFEITRNQYLAFFNNRRKSAAAASPNMCDPARPATDEFAKLGSKAEPRICITEADLKAYLKWLQAQAGREREYRLPTDIEFAYALKNEPETQSKKGIVLPQARAQLGSALANGLGFRVARKID